MLVSEWLASATVTVKKFNHSSRVKKINPIFATVLQVTVYGNVLIIKSGKTPPSET